MPPMVSTAGVDAPVEISFPSDDESVGYAVLGWRACAYTDVAGWARLHLLWAYLTESAVAPLTKHLVECEEPFCAALNTGHEAFSSGYYQLWCEDADVETLAELPSAVRNAREGWRASRSAAYGRLPDSADDDLDLADDEEVRLR